MSSLAGFCSVFTKRANWEVTVQHFSMAKELPTGNIPPDVFQLFNTSRTYYFESDISSLPMPPATVAPPTGPSIAKLRKSRSTPHLLVTDSSTGACVVSTGGETSQASRMSSSLLHLPTAVMATAPVQDPIGKHSQLDSAYQYNSMESRYQTEPSYASSGILKSFKHEFTLFGHGTHHHSGSVSNPSSPRRGSFPELDVTKSDESRPRTNSDPRKLSLVTEETVDQESLRPSEAVVAPLGGKDCEKKSQRNRSKLLGSGGVDRVDGQLMKGDNLPLTKQVVGWFTTPQRQVESNRTEFNAFTPTSF